MIDSELFQKLQARRKDVDLHGTTWVVEQEADNAQEPEESSPNRLRRVHGKAGSRPALPPGEPAGAGCSELERKLQARRSHVESKGDTYQKLPENSVADARISPIKTPKRKKRRSQQQQQQQEQPALPDSLSNDNVKFSLEAVRGLVALPIDDPDRNALLEMLMEAPSWPWEDLARGSRTWVCSAWVAEPLYAIDQRQEPLSPPLDGNRSSFCDTGPAKPRAHPAVLCIAADGEVMCCVAAQAPPGVEEEFFNQEADYAHILGLFSAKQLQVICSSPSLPQARRFHFSSAGQMKRDLRTEPSLIALFESEEEATTFAASAEMFAESPVLQESEPKQDAPDFTEVFAPATPPSETPLGSFDEVQAEAGPRPPEISKVKISAFLTETQAFLQELDLLAGFA